MDNKTYIEELDSLQKKIKELLKESVSEELYDTWADTFDIEEIGTKKIIVAYHGTQPIKKFKKECEELLWSCICSVAGYREKIKIYKKKSAKIKNPKVKKNIKAANFFVIGMIFACIAVAIILLMCNYIGNRNFRETFYSVSSLKVDNQIRVIQLSDLHTCSYGENNEKLIDRIEKLKPDLIVCTGDILDIENTDIDYFINLSSKLSAIAPSYYIYGNHEVVYKYDFALVKEEIDKAFGFNKDNRDETKLLELEDSFEDALEKAGINVLKNEMDTITVGTTKLDIYGVLTSNPSAFWPYSGKSFSKYLYEETDNLKITAIHEPFIFEELEEDFWGDLMLCGHAHGGVVRIPVLGPLYTREGGLFPERKGYFVYGRYDVAGRPLIVSSGLDNNNLSRINNQPEIVIIDINKF